MFDPPSQAAAGWYPDPHRPGTRRWWNGTEWLPAWDDAPGEVADGRLPGIGPWLDGSFRQALSRWRASAAIGLVTAGVASVLVGLAMRHLFSDVVLTNDDVIGWDADRLPLAIALVVAAVLIGLIGQLGLTVLMLKTIDGEGAASTTADELELGGRALIDGLRVLPRAIGWGLVVAGAVISVFVVMTGLALVAPLLLLLAIPAAIPAVVYLAVRFAFLPQSIVDRSGQPFTRSMDVSYGRFWPVLGRLLLISVIVWMISAALSVVNGIASGNFASGFSRQIELDDDGTVGTVELADAFATSPLALVVGVVVAVATAVLVTGVSAAAFAILYRTVNPRDDLTAR